jgi:cell division septation protein DedD
MASGLMTKQATWLARVLVMLVLGFTFAGATHAQTQTMTVAVRNFEIIAVDGNHLILRDERGTSDYFVPADFVFTVDGKKMTVADLKAGMKGTATVTTTTTITPVTVTELRSGVVLSTFANSVTVLDRSDSVRKKFTQDQLNARGLQIFKDGKVIPISQLNKGDEITATVISQRPPEVVTEREVEATLAQAKPEAPAAKSEPAAAKTEPAPAKTEAPATAAPSPTPMATTAAAPASAPVESSGLGTGWYVLIAVIIAAVLFLIMRRRKDENQSP